jgi:hypothetical protein
MEDYALLKKDTGANNMKKLILTLFLTLTFTFSFAEWKDYNEISKDLALDPTLQLPSREEFNRIYDANKQFGQRFDRNTSGLHLFAADRYSFSMVEIRFKDNLLELKINFSEKTTYEGIHNVLINLLDEDRFLVCSLHIDNVTFPFRGRLYKKEPFSLKILEKVKFYEFEYR